MNSTGKLGTVQSSKYHPDKWKGDSKTANDRMAQINLAYATLSDPVKRKEYDSKTAKSGASFSDNLEEEESEFDQALSELEGRWRTAVQVFPDLVDTRARLARASRQLAFAFVTSIIQTKKFNQRHQLAELMEQSFLERYFGDNPLVIKFARVLIALSRRDAIKALNRYVEVLGADLPAEKIIRRMGVEFNLYPTPPENGRTTFAHGITFDGEYYRFREYRYEKLADAVRYAELVLGRERRGDQ